MGIKLVIVDDAPFIRELIKQILEATEIQVIAEAADGEEAVEMVLRHRPDVVLMDIVMPKKSGTEASIEILEKFPGARIIACSTLDQETMVMKALEAGCCHYLVKPFESKQLIEAIRSSIKSPGPQQEKV